MKTIWASTLKICLVSLLFTVFTCKLAHGQDIIVQKNGEEIKAKVEQVLDMEIKYRKFDNMNGPVYTIKKSEVFMIKYANGSKDMFNTQAPPVNSQLPSGQPSKGKVSYNDIQPAKTGSIINYAMVIPIMALGIISATSDDADNAIGFGAGATVVGGIGIPVGAIISGKTRRITGVNGSPGLRIAGWIGYGLTIADAVTMLALSGDVDFTGGPTISVAVLGSLSSVFLALDGHQAASQAQSLASAATLQPIVGYYRDMAGNRIRTFGIRLNF